MARSKKTNSTAIQAAERRNLALKLRRQGLTYEAIGKKLNISAERAYKIVSESLKLIRVNTNETGEEIKTLELQRLDKLLEVANKQAEAGSLQAIDRCIRLMERRAKLLGLDSPDKLQHSGNIDGNINVTIRSPEEIEQEILNKLAAIEERYSSEGSN